MRNGIIENKWRDRGWYSIGKLDRTDGPAVEYSDGTREWWLTDRLHREDGPAVEGADGTREWWLNGREYTEEDYEIEIRLRAWGLSVDL